MYFTETTVSEDVTELFESKQKISYELKRLNALENRLNFFFIVRLFFCKTILDKLQIQYISI